LLTTDDIAARVMEAKGFDAADTVLTKGIREQVLIPLRLFRKRRTVEQARGAMAADDRELEVQ
jgi:hypothetical protein